MWYFVTENRSALQGIKVLTSIVWKLKLANVKYELIINHRQDVVYPMGYFLISAILYLDDDHYRIIGKQISVRVLSKKFHWPNGSNWQYDFPFSIFVFKVSFMAWWSQSIVWRIGSMRDWISSSKGWKWIYNSSEWLYDATNRRRSRSWSSTNCGFNRT